MHEARGDEQPRGAVQRSPALVAAEDAANVTHDRCIARGDARGRRSGAGTTDCHRGRIAHSASATRPIAPIAPSGPPSAVPSGLDDSSTCGASRTRPVIATRRCQIAARSIPSNHSSTHGQRADEHEADRQQQDRLGAQQLPDVAPGRLPGGPCSDHRTPWATTRTPIVVGPTSRAANLPCTSANLSGRDRSADAHADIARTVTLSTCDQRSPSGTRPRRNSRTCSGVNGGSKSSARAWKHRNRCAM